MNDCGTQLQHADTGAHWQNGHAEKRVDVIETRAHALLEVAGMPMKYFTDAVIYVTALDNRLPTHRGASPIDAFLRPSGIRKGNITLAPFGCRALAARPVDLRRKKDLIQRRDECILLGLASGSKNGYKLLKLSTGKTIVSHNVRFHPSNFPFQDAIDVKEINDDYEDLVEEHYGQNPDLPIPSSTQDNHEVLVDEQPSIDSSSPDIISTEIKDIHEDAAQQDNVWDSEDEESDNTTEDDNMDAPSDMYVQDHAFFLKHQPVQDEDLIFCLNAIEDIDKPPTRLSQALAAHDKKKWKAAMIDEIPISFEK